VLRLTRAISVLFWGAPDGAIPGRSCPHGLKAPSVGRRERHPVGGVIDWREPQRRYPTDPADRSSPPPSRGRGKVGGHARSQTVSSLTVAMTTTSTAGYCGHWGSHPSSPAAEQQTAPGWAASAGSSSVASRTHTTSGACGSATSATPICTPHSRHSPTASSAGDTSTHFERPS
jgi:hypothetical protein